MKCIEEQIYFDIPSGWSWTKINTIAFVTKLAGFEYSSTIAPNLCESGIPLFKGKNVQDGQIVYEFESFIPEAISDALPRSQITRKCILTPYVGTIGNIGIHSQVGKFHLGSNVGKIELYNDINIILEEYVVAYLKSSLGNRQLTKHMKATAQASISIEAIRDVYIPIPPEKEQKRLCEKLAETLNIVDSIDNATIDVDNIISLLKSKILDLAIRGKLIPKNPEDEPASVLLERIQAEKEELVKQGKIKRDKKESVIFRGDDNSYYEQFADNTIKCINDDIPFEIPNSWRWGRISSCSEEIFAGGDKPKNYSKTQTEQFPYPIYSNGVENNGLYGYTDIPRVIKPSVTVSGRGTIGFSCVRKIPFFPIIRLLTITPTSFVSVEFLDFVFKYLMESGAGSSIPQLTVPMVKPKLIPLPPLAEQKRIVEAIETVFAQLDEIASSIT